MYVLEHVLSVHLTGSHVLGNKMCEGMSWEVATRLMFMYIADKIELFCSSGKFRTKFEKHARHNLHKQLLISSSVQYVYH